MGAAFETNLGKVKKHPERAASGAEEMLLLNT
jgi:hypothetical protein